ncbi:MAG: bifunctional 3,4-dihydroxy-2-butanone-4-phosphate synthase/GTP cyclohydrolase II [Deltaproteobacteria bacterium]|nr:bifunctional 3,4-dihydroxy-2-butanone-4-phosphate synthase/GTP cyclohydrolase II [Deltaproteobacteria bacterium]
MKHRATVEEACDELRRGRMLILVDDEDRENEGDLAIAAEHATAEAIHFMTRHGRGLVCIALTEDRIAELGIRMMTEENRSSFGTAFTVSVDARLGIESGEGAADRAHTVKVLLDPASSADDLASPGHLFPLRARKGGVLVRAGQTEGSVDLSRIAGLQPAAVICEVMRPDGTMARMPDLEAFAGEHDLKILTVADLIAYRMRNERLVHRIAESKLPTVHGGEFRVIVYKNDVDPHEHLALVKGTLEPGQPTLVRVHSECLTGDVFGSMRCDCGEQLHAAMEMLDRTGSGVIVYIHQEGRGIGLGNKILAYALQDQGKDTVEANEALGFKPDLRDYGLGAQIIRDLGITKMRLITNNPTKITGLVGYGLSVVDRVPIEVPPNEVNRRYLETKRAKMGHVLNLEPDAEPAAAAREA